MGTRAPLPLVEPEPYGFLYLGLHVDEPQKAPLYHQSESRRRAATHLVEAARELEHRPDVHSTRVFRTHLVPPLSGAPRHDLAMLIRTTRVDDLAGVRDSDPVRALGGTELLAGSNAARIGDTEPDEEATEDAVILFNHFTSAGDADPVEAWLGLTDWYTSTIGVDNSTALRPIDDGSEFALVNYVRLRSNPPRFLLNQLLRPSFHRVVRGTLKRNELRALPGFYRMIR
ncbi:hypothetical protein [Actinophytocola gossypii]|uniref:Uncharacterized protein n=1 Tax=Actinophytocola gossypii TaxID=2812003 RepID=A0ABT2JA87_9PSEU|nr:hypothetical protein [Actinophytocola gossypii]MCT2584199.1 hypothetical protein [Actinophytocola gossypii]